MPRLGHHVFFTLQDASRESVDALLAACRKYLTGHEGVTDFAVGVRDEGLTRPVNDSQYHVSLHVTFRDRAAHDVYQTHPRHEAFIEEQKGNWKSVRVFDSLLEDDDAST
jgi:quinol monooxygenase YgiN